MKQDFVANMDMSPIALVADKANEQHYEVSAEFFAEVLRPNLKYSACYWVDEALTLEQAETDTLSQTCRRAGPLAMER